MGSTCLDEWTMAVSGVAMSSAVFLAGGGAWSLDERYIAPTGLGAAQCRGSTGSAAGRCRATWCPSSRCGSAACRIAFTLLTYHILFGAVVTPLHSRVNFHRHDIALTHAAARSRRRA